MKSKNAAHEEEITLPSIFEGAEQFTQQEMDDFFTRQYLACEEPIRKNALVRAKSFTNTYDQVFI
ncbi:MAG: hypothetical protein PHZ25_00255 [Candidatus Pacebacteria bacterium]|nr:hypothetical protein [Candidatus Paceibacterota bacterium]